MRTFSRTLARTGVLQIDSVNVLQRAHYMPLFSRMGSYDTELLRRASERSPRRMVEYWAHVAAYMPVDLWPYMQHRMQGYRDRGHAWTQEKASVRLVDSLMAEIREDGAKTSRDLDDGLPRSKVDWGWNWSETKRALEYLFISGRARRRPPQQPVRAGLRPAGAGDPVRGPRPADAEPARDPGRAGPSCRSLPRRRHGSVPA